jgi:excisionase family DNA binding protein
MPKAIDLNALRADTKLSSTQAASLLGVAPPTMMKYARLGRIKAFRVGNLYKFLWSDLQEFIQANDAEVK